MTNVSALQDTLDRLTADIARWDQSTWCRLRADAGTGAADPLTPANLETLRYHDFKLSDDLVAELRHQDADTLRDNIVPIADCGTSFCVAGDVCVNNGYTFVAKPGDPSTVSVVLTRELELVLRENFDTDTLQSAPYVAQEILDLNHAEANTLFVGNRSLPELWGLAYLYTDGEIVLPESLPESERWDSDLLFKSEVPAVPAGEVKRTVLEAALAVAEDRFATNWVTILRQYLNEIDA